MVYARQLPDGKVLDFGVSGALYHDALVLYDRETGSYWSQITGEAIRGPLTGHKLSELPSEVTTWGQWRRAHPDTLLLVSESGPRGSPYANYSNDPDKLGVLGTRNPDPRLPGKTWVWGIAEGKEAVALVEERLSSEARMLSLGGRSVSVRRDGDRLVISPEASVRALRTYWFVWARFHPGSRIFPER